MIKLVCQGGTADIVSYMITQIQVLTHMVQWAYEQIAGLTVGS